MFDRNAIRHMADITRVQARDRGSEVALWFEGRETSFAALDARASQVSNGLVAEGAAVQDRIGWLGKNMDVYYEIAFGCMKAGMAMCGINNRLAAPEIEFILTDARVSVLFVMADFYDVAASVAANCPDLKTIIAVEGEHPEWRSYEQWRGSQSAVDAMRPVDPDADVIQLYTSGTTGLPKGVQLTDANYTAFFGQATDLGWAQYGLGETVMNVMPLFHVAGVNVGLLAAAQGVPCVVVREVDPTQILELIEEKKIVHTVWVPAVILMLTQHPKAKEIDWSSLQNVTYGASPIAEDLVINAMDLMGAKFTQVYGLTETTAGGTYLPPEAHDPAWNKLRSCGVPYPGAIIKCVDDDGDEVETGQVGEIVIQGDFVMKGYWNRPEATEDAIRNSFFHTGDAGYFDDDGFLFIYDRVKDMIVSGAENVYPAEVENALFSHPDVADVAVIGIPSEQWGEAVKAIIVPKPGTSPTAESIIAFAKERIAGYKAPKSVDFVEALPRNPSGKILRKDLRKPYWDGHDRKVG